MSGAELSRRALLWSGAAAACVPATSLARQAAPVTAAPAGVFEGTHDGDVHVYRGIRYGRGERFRAPVAVARPGERVRAREFGPVCPQRGARYLPQSEDCLFLNIWAPADAAAAPRPVLVYFHGGAYSTGSVTDPLNDGAALARETGAVVVTVNHRLNAFGYLYLARLDPRFRDSGNAGQLDLILALTWIRDNIAAFGGDPACVTPFGQSGGGAKIATLMGMPAARGLFHRAMTMSGQQVTASGPLNATERTRAYLARLGVAEGDFDALLAAPSEALVEALDAVDPILGGGVYFGPVLDMQWLLRHPFWPDAHPQSNHIPMILGNTHDETRAFIGPDSAVMQGLDWGNIAERLGPQLRVDILPEWVVAQYRQRFPQDGPRELFWRATTAARSWRGQVEEADARARAGAEATWVYQLDFPSQTEPERGAFHTHDIPLVFGTLGAEGSQTGTGAAARRVSREMMTAFAQFARTGRAPWRRYTLPDRPTMIFDTRSRVEQDPRQWERELFARVPYVQPGT